MIDSYLVMASINRHLPSPGSAVWRRDVSSLDGTSGGIGGDSNKVRHVVIRDAEIREVPSPHVVYRIDVLTEHDHWYIYHRYSHFYALHKKVSHFSYELCVCQYTRDCCRSIKQGWEHITTHAHTHTHTHTHTNSHKGKYCC